ncbi:MAG: hypothetical protein GY703_14020 [Gammaproteobacteria bacterium]|nr:hypothetical protein [Gammaproteobacteria bacterium]
MNVRRFAGEIRYFRSRFGTASAALITLLVTGYGPSALADVYNIRLVDDRGSLTDLGTFELSGPKDNRHYRIDWDENHFESHFLSMRPFKCLPHPTQLICHLPYPYENRRSIRDGDLTDLEYDTLFLFKAPGEYGINAWNGLYFKYRQTERGFEGDLFETDLNVLQAPPEKGNLRPIDPGELYEASDKHWPRRMVIERTGVNQ